MERINMYFDAMGKGVILSRNNKRIECSIEELSQLTIDLVALFKIGVKNPEEEQIQEQQDVVQEIPEEIIEEVKQEVPQEIEPQPIEVRVAPKPQPLPEPPKPTSVRESPAKKLVSRLEKLRQRIS